MVKLSQQPTIQTETFAVAMAIWWAWQPRMR